jgi:hypothetical protein
LQNTGIIITTFGPCKDGSLKEQAKPFLKHEKPKRLSRIWFSTQFAQGQIKFWWPANQNCPDQTKVASQQTGADPESVG